MKTLNELHLFIEAIVFCSAYSQCYYYFLCCCSSCSSIGYRREIINIIKPRNVGHSISQSLCPPVTLICSGYFLKLPNRVTSHNCLPFVLCIYRSPNEKS